MKVTHSNSGGYDRLGMHILNQGDTIRVRYPDGTICDHLVTIRGSTWVGTGRYAVVVTNYRGVSIDVPLLELDVELLA